MAEKYSRIIKGNRNFGLLAYPAPYRAWLSMLSDPDNMTRENWLELKTLIYDELKLPFAENIFIRSVNDNFPDQLNLENCPEIAKECPIDSIHTWGDYVHSSTVAFSRHQAFEAIQLLRNAGIQPRIWVDHSSFIGNIFHKSRVRNVPKYQDHSGIWHEVPSYTTDLIAEVGIRYLWDGSVIEHTIGQDRPISRLSHYVQLKGSLKGLFWTIADLIGRPLWKIFGSTAFDYHSNKNNAYQVRKLEDGSQFYAFPRYGNWIDSDIDGLYKILNDAYFEQLINNGGTSIIYMHLGKRNGFLPPREKHIPQNAHQSLQKLATYFNDGKIKVSPTNQLLDYLLIRDNVNLDQANHHIQFKSDSLRFNPLTINTLQNFEFSIQTTTPQKIKVTLDGSTLEHKLKTTGMKNIFNLEMIR
jgi:hypothetical protein